jgi:hypothetical protein
MADLFSLTAPLLIRYPDGTRHVMVERFVHPQGLLYCRTFWDRMPLAQGMLLVEGEVRGDGPWKVGDAVVSVLGCHGSSPSEAAEYADWEIHRDQSGASYPDREQIAALARAAGYLP